jgi:class 3 adenylate cyclase/tetratricopeptide (TPR) repeat protein
MAVPLRTLASYVPVLIQRRFGASVPSRTEPVLDHFAAAVLFADITGFTALTERLAAHGPAGAEELTRLLNAYFDQLITLILAHGGDILKFAGDAQIAVWPVTVDEDLTVVTLRAAQCALAVQQALNNYKVAENIHLSMRVGIAAGDVVTMHVGGVRERWELLIAGPPLEQVGSAEHQAKPGDVVVSAEAWARVRGACTGIELEHGAVRLVAVRKPVPSYQLTAPLSAAMSEAALWAYIPGAIRARLAAGQTGWLAELRRVTVLFVNLPGLRPTMAGALARTQEVMQALQTALYHYEGSINKLSVDEKGITLVAALGLPPLFHEDDAVRGVQAAQAMQTRLRDLGLHPAIGITTGRAYCGEIGNIRRREYTLIGAIVNLAARLMQAAPDDILCDTATFQSSRGRLQFDELAPITVKGRDEPVPVFRPRGHALVAPGPQPLFGRRVERLRLAERLDALRASSGGVLVLEGEAGIGKSRLIVELLDQARLRNLTCFASAGDAIERSTPYHAWRPVFSQVFGLDGLVTLEERRARVLSMLHSQSEFLRAPLLNSVLPVDLPENEITAQMTGEVHADNTHELLLHFLQAATNQAPTLLVIEDAQWLDSASWALAALVAQRVGPLLLVLATRPLPNPPPQEYGQLLAAPDGERLRLGALEGADVLDLVCQRLGVADLPEPVTQLIQEKAQGNPFYSEELAYALRDAGLILVENDRCRIAPGVDWQSVSVPDSVQGVVTSRIDRLSPELQLTVKVASVIGRVFAVRLLHDVHPIERDRAGLMDYLQTLEHLDLTALETPAPDLAYLFKHIITQEVAYNLMLFAQRQQLHHAVAEWYERNYAADLSPFYPLLAHHWRRAQEPVKTADYAEKAGEQALERGAYQEAVGFFREALALTPVTGQNVLRVARWERELGEAYLNLGDMPASRQHLEQAVALLGYPIPVGSKHLVAKLLVQVLVQTLHRLIPRRFLRTTLATEGHVLEAVRAYLRLGEIYYLNSETGPLVHATLLTTNLTETAGVSPELARSYANICVAAGLAPFPLLAEIYYRLARKIADQVGQLSATGWVMEITSVYAQGVGSWERVEEGIARALQIFDQLGDRSHWGESQAIRAQAAHFQGKFAEGIRIWAELYGAARSRGDVLQEAWGLNGQAEGALRLGRLDEAAEMLEAAAVLFVNNLDRVSEVSTYGHLAVVRWRRGEPESALKAAAKGLQLGAELKSITGYYALAGFGGVAEAYLASWEAECRRGGGARPEVIQSTLQACAGMHRYARIFPIGRPHAWLWQGLADWLAGRPRRACKAWRKSLEEAERLAMPFEQGRAHYEMGRHLEAHARARQQHLTRACDLFTLLGTPYELTEAQAALRTP